ncbi:MAG: thioredoxin family protein [Candidatus Omnitrophica bacterium]|nr:thioredoxin family protein [Candidatus Omnitrophota bacterium]MDD5737347.1 thioredoxin family protein [Candidatus Omnitrophota bacterium]
MKRSRIFALAAALLYVSVAASSACAAITWAGNLDSALKEAKSKNKPIMADFYTDWCEWCKKLDRDTYADPEVANLSRKFICVKVNGDKYPDLVSKYGVSGYPTIIFLDPAGDKADAIVGYVNAEGMLSSMNSVLSKMPVEKSAGNWKSKVNDWWSGVKKTDSAQETKTTISEPAASDTVAAAKGAIYSDVLELNSGRKIQGLIESQDDLYYNIKLPLGKTSIKKTDVKEVRKLSPEEACVMMGDKYYDTKNYDAAMAEYSRALSINPGYKPAKVSLDSAKQKKFEVIEQEKNRKKLEEESSQEVSAEETVPAAEQAAQPSSKKISFGFNVMNREMLKRKYDYKDFGFSVDDALVVNGFYARNPESCKPVYPAQEAGLRPGDKIVAINGEAVGGLTAAEATKLIGSHRYTKFVIERP